MSLQERTLVIRNFDPDLTTPELLKELCMQTGPIRKVVKRDDHAFVEYEDVESVAYSKAMLDGVSLFGRSLIVEPKIRDTRYSKYVRALGDYIRYDKTELEPKRIAEQMQQIGYQHQMPTITALPQQFLTVPQSQRPQQFIQPFEANRLIPGLPFVQQSPVYQYPIQSNFQQPNFQQTNIRYQQPPIYQQPIQHDFDAPADVLQFQYTQTSPYIANPLLPAPEGSGYMPWLHEKPDFTRSRSLNKFNQSLSQPRRLSNEPANFTERRR